MYGFSQALIECNDSMHVLTCIAYSLFNMQNGYMFFDFCEGHVNFQDIAHQLQEKIFVTIFIVVFYEIFIKLRCISNPLKTI